MGVAQGLPLGQIVVAFALIFVAAQPSVLVFFGFAALSAVDPQTFALYDDAEDSG